MEKEYKIELNGCDDSSEITFTLTEKEYETLQKIAEKIKDECPNNCQPSLVVAPKEH